MTEKQYNELKCLLLEIREGVSKITDKVGSELLTPREVCAILKVSRNTYQNYVNNKVFVQTKIGGRVYVQRAEIDRLIEEGKI